VYPDLNVTEYKLEALGSGGSHAPDPGYSSDPAVWLPPAASHINGVCLADPPYVSVAVRVAWGRVHWDVNPLLTTLHPL